jgi:hypothetical protein
VTGGVEQHRADLGAHAGRGELGLLVKGERGVQL